MNLPSTVGSPASPVAKPTLPGPTPLPAPALVKRGVRGGLLGMAALAALSLSGCVVTEVDYPGYYPSGRVYSGGYYGTPYSPYYGGYPGGYYGRTHGNYYRGHSPYRYGSGYSGAYRSGQHYSGSAHPYSGNTHAYSRNSGGTFRGGSVGRAVAPSYSAPANAGRPAVARGGTAPARAAAPSGVRQPTSSRGGKPGDAQ